MPWYPEGEPWQYRVLDHMKPGVDRAQLAAALEMSFEQRLAKAEELAALGEELRRALAAKKAGA
ncbi:MAG: hypothetical protein U0235_30905 [Polyangiaceae bacterium]